jgi:hypothetical protein
MASSEKADGAVLLGTVETYTEDRDRVRKGGDGRIYN